MDKVNLPLQGEAQTHGCHGAIGGEPGSPVPMSFVPPSPSPTARILCLSSNAK
jgi:hypothetical protein